VIGERPGVTARELAAASRVTGGTLYTLLRRLTDDGTVEKRELPGGQAGYALAASGATAQPTDAQADSATSSASAAAESRAAAGPAHDRPDSAQTADAARSPRSDAQPS
jgi:DNA-binding PadR family transcriptional regulator